MQFAPQIFQVMGMGVRASLMSSLITNAVNMGATLVAIFTVDRCCFTISAHLAPKGYRTVSRTACQA